MNALPALEDLEVFVRAVELSSIAAAARTLSMTTSAANYRLGRLESRYATRLYNRTTRRLRPTEAGLAFYRHALAVLQAMALFRNCMEERSGAFAGDLRIRAPAAFGRMAVAPAAAAFSQRYPRARLHLQLTDQSPGRGSDQPDIVIRAKLDPFAAPEGEDIGLFEQTVCAEPGYLARRGRPRRLADLAAHPLLVDDRGPEVWRFDNHGGIEGIDSPTRLHADDGDAVTQLALAGAGLAVRPIWEIAPLLGAGRLQALDLGAPPLPLALEAIFPRGGQGSAKLKAVLALVIASTKPHKSPFEINPGGSSISQSKNAA